MTDTPGPYVLPDLPYDYNALEPYLNARILELHHGKHHAAYVKGANDTIEKLRTAGPKAEAGTIAALERTLAFNLSGHVLHSLYWANLSPSPGAPDAELTEQLERDFGGVDAFRARMTQMVTSVQGSGWALASWEPVAERISVQQVHDHQADVGAGTLPLLAIDAWEHAYYLQYQSDRPAYASAIWNIVNWTYVSERLAEVRRATAQLAVRS